jgi:hypothetical protein
MSAATEVALTAEQKAWLDSKIKEQVYGAPISDAAIADILNRVGLDYVPSDLERQQLKDEINLAWKFYTDYTRLSSKGQRTKLRKYAGNVHKALNALSDVLNQESYEADIFRYGWISRAFPLNDFRIRLHHLMTRVATFQTMCSSPLTLRDALKESPEHWFLGHDLRRIFEKHFKLQATRSVDGSRGPFVCFAIAVSSALGMDVSDSTVSKAMTNLAHFFRPGLATTRPSDWYLDEFGNLSRLVENS